MVNAIPLPEPAVPVDRTYRAVLLRKTYGMSLEDYDDLLRSQGGRCAICRKAPSPTKMLAVDHNHRTGVIRGLLCHLCNTGLGVFRESPDLMQRALDYLYEDPMWRSFANHPGRD